MLSTITGTQQSTLHALSLETLPLISSSDQASPSTSNHPSTCSTKQIWISTDVPGTSQLVLTSSETQPLTSSVTQPSTSLVTRPSTSSVTRPSTSSVTLPSTSSVTLPSMSSVTWPSTSSVTLASTSSMTQPSMSLVTLASAFSATQGLTSASALTSQPLTATIIQRSAIAIIKQLAAAIPPTSSSVAVPCSTDSVPCSEAQESELYNEVVPAKSVFVVSSNPAKPVLDMWIDDLFLYDSDRGVLTSPSAWLNDSIIHAVQLLLKKQDKNTVHGMLHPQCFKKSNFITAVPQGADLIQILHVDNSRIKCG